MKKNILSHKGFIATVQFSTEDEVFFGRIEEIDDLVTFEGRTVETLKSSFEAAVEDYISACEKNRKPLFKSFKGSFNIRVSPELHRMAVRKALEQGLSLNKLVETALEHELGFG